VALILNIETTTTVCSVCISDRGNVIALKQQGGEYTHAENLTVFIENVLAQCGKTLKDIDAVAVSEGPGSYTGLRIGVSVAKGLCYSLDVPLIAVNTLQHFSFAISSNEKYKDKTALYCPMIDARRMEVYNAIYDSNNTMVLPVDARIIDNDSFADILSKKNNIYFFGNGAEKCKDVLSGKENAIFISGAELSSESMSHFSYEYFLANQFKDVAYFEPFYLKAFFIKK
jgi:tRNA threonylcarbamoyladenosine biosynthesis protein TsaB